MIHVGKLVAGLVITVGGALSGVMSGSSLGPIRLELERMQMEWVGAACGALLAVIGCCLATEYNKARDRNRAYIRQMRRLASLRFE